VTNEGKSKKGLVIVHTGDGKGKTTAALGMAFRAAGYGMPVLMVQFIKGSWHYGELDAAKKFEGILTIRPMGEGFPGIQKILPETGKWHKRLFSMEFQKLCQGNTTWSFWMKSMWPCVTIM
jgi:ATP:corrinoid adenosyltransferase